jgi:hypothetical protein
MVVGEIQAEPGSQTVCAEAVDTTIVSSMAAMSPAFSLKRLFDMETLLPCATLKGVDKRLPEKPQ